MDKLEYYHKIIDLIYPDNIKKNKYNVTKLKGNKTVLHTFLTHIILSIS